MAKKKAAQPAAAASETEAILKIVDRARKPAKPKTKSSRPKKSDDAAVREEAERWLAMLRERDGVRAWNDRLGKRPRIFVGAELTAAKLSHVSLAKCDFSNARFDKATLYQARLDEGTFQQASFVEANLKSARLDRAQLEHANLAGADLSKANLTCANLQHANLEGAKLDRADLAFADLRGANLAGATLTDANLMGVGIDAQTRWPAGSPRPDGASPADSERSPQSGALPLSRSDLQTFMKHLASTSEPGRFERALKMLKAGRIQLFSEVTPEHVVGVVQSQSRDGSVYSCHLRQDGKFACVSTDLENCMGLGGGQPCKHLIVLMIGLVQSGQFDPGVATLWLSTKAKRGTRKDSNVLAETLIRYKGAVAGEVDWRPTETVPEDFYAF